MGCEDKFDFVGKWSLHTNQNAWAAPASPERGSLDIRPQSTFFDPVCIFTAA